MLRSALVPSELAILDQNISRKLTTDFFKYPIFMDLKGVLILDCLKTAFCVVNKFTDRLIFLW